MRRPAARLPKRPPRSEPRDGPLGHGAGARPEHQRADGPDEEPKALAHLKQAQALKSKASQRERDYIDALAARYTGKTEDRVAADQAYAGAMRALYQKYPDDEDAATCMPNR